MRIQHFARNGVVAITLALWFCSGLLSAHGSLAVKVEEEFTGSKGIIKLSMRNTYTNAVQSARAAVFLMDDKGKLVGQKAEWVIGGTKDKPALPPLGTNVFHVVVPSEKPFTKVNVIFTRIILEGGEVIPAGQGYKIEQ